MCFSSIASNSIWLDNTHKTSGSLSCWRNTNKAPIKENDITPGTATGPRRNQLDANITKDCARDPNCCKHTLFSSTLLNTICKRIKQSNQNCSLLKLPHITYVSISVSANVVESAITFGCSTCKTQTQPPQVKVNSLSAPPNVRDCCLTTNLTSFAPYTSSIC